MYQPVLVHGRVDVELSRIERLRSATGRADRRDGQIVRSPALGPVGSRQRVSGVMVVATRVSSPSDHEIPVALRSARDPPDAGVIPLPAEGNEQPATALSPDNTVAVDAPDARQWPPAARLSTQDASRAATTGRERHRRSAGLL
jgi:hypothetical protein